MAVEMRAGATPNSHFKNGGGPTSKKPSDFLEGFFSHLGLELRRPHDIEKGL
jgi:hypothetical protein